MKTQFIHCSNQNTALLSVQPMHFPVGGSRPKAAVVCVVDISGSMSSMASVKNENGKAESHGLSYLDVVKHAVKTVIHCLETGDSLAIVSFHSTAKVEMELTMMDKKGKDKALKVVESLQTAGTTNLWDGLLKGLDCLRTHGTRVQFNSNIMVFTDGIPNVNPPEPHVTMLQKYKDEHGLDATISTFGFGYNMQSDLLTGLAAEGSGFYGFIPDSSLVGTIFVNAVSNQLARCCKDVVLNIERDEEFDFVMPSGEGCLLKHFPHYEATWGVAVHLGTMQFGQSRDMILQMKKQTKAPELSLSWTDLYTGERKNSCLVEMVSSDHLESRAQADRQLARCKAIACIANPDPAFVDATAADVAEAKHRLESLLPDVPGESLRKAIQHVEGIAKDLTGEVKLAMLPDNAHKWGRHFLPSLLSAHVQQICNNFKDPGVQGYGAEGIFKKLRDHADDLFVKLPPPKPSCQRKGYTSAPTNMKAYYNACGGCFTGSAHIKLADGSLARVDHLKKGDEVDTCDGPAIVLCVVNVKKRSSQKWDLIRLSSGLELTPYHPVVHPSQGCWAFPCELDEGVEVTRQAEQLYDLVLSNGHSVYLNGVECVTLGHNFSEDVVRHEYFGSECVVNDLASFPGYRSGRVTLYPDNFIRDLSGLVTGIKA